MIDVRECGSHMAASEALSQAQAVGWREFGRASKMSGDDGVWVTWNRPRCFGTIGDRTHWLDIRPRQQREFWIRNFGLSMPEGEDGRGWRGHGEGESPEELGGSIPRKLSCEVPAKSWFQPALCPSGVASLPLANVSMRLQGAYCLSQ
jgi:hypothetical protein